MKMTFRWYGADDPVTLEKIRQIPTMSGIVSAVYDIKPGGVWSEESILRIKKQAEDAIFARFQPQPRGRRKATASKAEAKSSIQSSRMEARKAKTRAKRLEAKLKESRERVEVLETGLRKLVEELGFRMVKARRPRRAKKA